MGMSILHPTDWPKSDIWEVVGDVLIFNGVRIGFIRTLRVSENGLNALPAGVGQFPVRVVNPSDPRLPQHIRERGGVMLPIYPFEAMWLNFSCGDPAALQVGVGGRCAITGGELTDDLIREPQNYVVLPDQPWLDGFKTGDDEVRQFVAVALGSGLTVEQQLTGSESVGGLQFQVRFLTPEALERWRAAKSRSGDMDFMVFCDMLEESVACGAPMGLGAGGRIDQVIYEDDFDDADWQTTPAGKVWVHLVAAADWTRFTGEPAPSTPITAEAYAEAGLPWFDYWNPTGVDVATTPEMEAVKSIGQLTGEVDDTPAVGPDDESVWTITPEDRRRVAPGEWLWTGRDA